MAKPKSVSPAPVPDPNNIPSLDWSTFEGIKPVKGVAPPSIEIAGKRVPLTYEEVYKHYSTGIPSGSDQDTISKCIGKISDPQKLPTPSDNDTAKIAAAMGAGKCVKSATKGFLLTLEGGGAMEHSQSSGCDTVNIMSSNFAQVQQVTNCLLTKINTSSSSIVKLSQNNSLQLMEGASLHCQTLNMTNNLDGAIGLTTEITSTVTNCIADMLKTSLANSMKSIQNNKSGWGSTPDGQKTLQQLAASMQSYISSTDITDIVQKAVSSVDLSQGTEVVINKNAIMTVDEACNITNDMVLKVQISTMMSNVIKDMFKTEDVSEIKNLISSDQKSESEGAPPLLDGLAILLPFLIIGGIVLFGGTAVNNVMKYIVPIGLVITIILAIVFAMRKDWILTGVDAVAFVGLLFFMFLSMKKSQNK